MSVPTFPEGECHPTESPHVFVHKPSFKGTNYRVWFRVGVQYFRISEFDSDELEEAQAHARMFVKALENYRAETNQAPELLEACKQSLALLDSRLDFCEILDGEKRHIDVLRGAIAKAEKQI